MEHLIAALTFGLTAGLKPGPLGIYVLHQTLTRGNRAGFIACFAPFVSDGPIIAACFAVLARFKQFDMFIVLISFAGAAYLLWIALKLLTSDPVEARHRETPSSLFTAVKINLLNPAPYIFWATVGGVYLVRGNLAEAAIFIVVFLTTLAVTKFAMAYSIKRLGRRFDNRIQVFVLKLLSVLLILFAASLVFDAIELLDTTGLKASS